MTQETKVGLFVLAGIVVLTFGIITLSDIPFEKRYRIKIQFNNIQGLTEQSQVFLSGVAVGKVEKIYLDEENKAVVVVGVKKDVKLKKDIKATILTVGFVGNKYVELIPGRDKRLLRDGDTIVGVDPISLDKKVDEALRALDRLVKTVEGVGGKGGLKDAIDNIIVASRNIKEISGDWKDITKQNKEKIGRVLDKFESVLGSLDIIAKQIEKAEGPVGKLISDKKLAEQIDDTITNIKEASKGAKSFFAGFKLWKPQFDYRLRYDLKDDRFRSDLGTKIALKKNRYLYLGLNNLGETSSSDLQQSNTLTAMIGQEFGSISVYGGAIRSNGGFGVEVKPAPRLTFSTDIFSLDRKIPKRSPWVNIGGKFEATKWLYIGAYVEDVFYKTSINATVDIVVEP